MYRIVLLTDDPHASTLPAFERFPHQLHIQGRTLPVAVPQDAPEAYIIDARTDLMDAKALCQRLKELAPHSVLLVLISEESASALGAVWQIDDFFTPETSASLFQARLRIRLGDEQNNTTESIIRAGALVIDPRSYSVYLNSHALNLTFKEFELLKFMAQHPGRAFSRAQLLSEVWGYDSFYGGTRTVDVHVRRLRSKLGSEYEHLISTVRNVGYSFASR
ncbi:MAG: response regulator transcription factor [Rothia sp. (in: high G+C Gram-positive bacteria)]|uniref:winged helix-turn-helix transcriptional regulator n=1 Tax=Rothia sp. (in: high G+C Gram-positive bacteria) TaxID=1885016 RepID=UPI0026E1120C|nr:response regulator transcription factor [Rothia sp. (in: high G+C Gram-positive bacteria)]MDO5749906.1 response regulator transcription factor [Rothia sp. (in: high G+C Gram-positive bacteria)]